MTIEIPAEAVEAAAKALAWRTRNHFLSANECWDFLTPEGRAHWESEALSALEAAAPYMSAPSKGLRDELVAILKDEDNYIYIDWTPELNTEATADAIIAAGFTK